MSARWPSYLVANFDWYTTAVVSSSTLEQIGAPSDSNVGIGLCCLKLELSPKVDGSALSLPVAGSRGAGRKQLVTVQPSLLDTPRPAAAVLPALFVDVSRGGILSTSTGDAVAVAATHTVVRELTIAELDSLIAVLAEAVAKLPDVRDAVVAAAEN